MKIASPILLVILTVGLMLTSCKKNTDELSPTKGIVDGPVCGFWIIRYGDSVRTNVQRITALNLPQEFHKPGLNILFTIEEGVAPQVICNTVIIPPPPFKYVSNVRLR